MPYNAPSGYGGSMGQGAQRDRITQALMSIQSPPPQTAMPPAPQVGPPLAGQNQPAPFPGGGMTGAMPGGPTAAQPMGGAPAPMGPATPPVQMPGGAMPMPGGGMPQASPMQQQPPAY